jgi:transcriptional regulator with XRE-family HTH domain
MSYAAIESERMELLVRKPPVTPAQCKAARALLDITQTRLAQMANAGLTTVVDFELGRRSVSAEKIQDIRLALENLGILFIDGNGVKLRRDRRK